MIRYQGMLIRELTVLRGLPLSAERFWIRCLRSRLFSETDDKSLDAVSNVIETH